MVSMGLDVVGAKWQVDIVPIAFGEKRKKSKQAETVEQLCLLYAIYPILGRRFSNQ